MRTFTQIQAEDEGYQVLAGPYKPNANETMMLSRVMTDMKGCRAVLVDTDRGKEIWRHKSEFDMYLRHHGIELTPED